MNVLPVGVIAGLLLYLGQRLVRSGLRSEGAELWLGLAFIPAGLGVLGRFAVAAGVDVGIEPGLANQIAQVAMHLGMTSFAAFVWRTFRKDEGWARTLFFGIAALFASNAVLFGLTGAAGNQSHPFHLVLSTCQAAVFAWAFAEAVAFHRSMRRRQTLGLADAVTTNRLGLFAVWTGCMTLLPLVLTTVRIINMVRSGQGLSPIEGGGAAVRPEAQWALSVIRVSMLAIGLPMIAAIWLSFFAPRRYESWLVARAEA